MSDEISISYTEGQKLALNRALVTDAVRIGMPRPPFGAHNFEWQGCGCYLVAPTGETFMFTPCAEHAAQVFEMYEGFGTATNAQK